MLGALVVCLAPAVARADDTPPLHWGWSPLVVPASLLAPGSSQLLRGERRAGGTMLAISGVAVTLSAAAGIFLIASGASDVSAAVGVPVLLLGVSTLLTLGLTDLVGAFGSGPSPPLTDTWDARVRVGLSLLAPMHAGAAPSPELYASWRAERWLVEGRVGITPNGAGPWLEGTAGVRVLGYTVQSPRAGLWVEAGLRGTGFESTRSLRGRAQLVSALPMGVFGERFSRLTSVMRLGVDPTWLWYRGVARPDFELLVSGGFELRFVASPTLRLVLGYEHARDGVVGGLATGFLGTFHAGMELALTPELFVVTRAQLGTPNAFTAGLEWRR